MRADFTTEHGTNYIGFRFGDYQFGAQLRRPYTAGAIASALFGIHYEIMRAIDRGDIHLDTPRVILQESEMTNFPHPAENEKAIHPAPVEFTDAQLEADPILRYFHYAHLPPGLQEISLAFCTLAEFIVQALPRNAERSVALRKLLEAEDAGVRANVPSTKPTTFYDRLLTENIELDVKIKKLDAFVQSSQFLELSDEQQNLLHQQFSAMRNYASALGRRIELNKPYADAGLTHAEDFPSVTPGERIADNARIIGGDFSDSAPGFKS